MRSKMLSSFVLASCGLVLSGSLFALRAEQPQEVQITLTDYKIASSTTTFQKGKPYRFVIANVGKKEHEWLIAPRGKDAPLIEVEDDELPPDKVVKRDFTFQQAGEFEFSCHYRNHYKKGMKLAIVVK